MPETGHVPIMFLQHSLQVTGRIIKILLPITDLIPLSKERPIMMHGEPVMTVILPTTVTIMTGTAVTGTADIPTGTATGKPGNIGS